MCIPLDRRTQILLDEHRYRLLEERARRGGTSVAAVIRSAIDRELDQDPDRTARAVASFLDAPPVDAGSWREIEADVEAGYERK